MTSLIVVIRSPASRFGFARYCKSFLRIILQSWLPDGLLLPAVVGCDFTGVQHSAAETRIPDTLHGPAALRRGPAAQQRAAEHGVHADGKLKLSRVLPWNGAPALAWISRRHRLDGRPLGKPPGFRS